MGNKNHSCELSLLKISVLLTKLNYHAALGLAQGPNSSNIKLNPIDC